jgi:hypothetical protein
MAYLGPTTGSLNVLRDVEGGSPHASSLFEEASLWFNGVSLGYFAHWQLPQVRPSFTLIYTTQVENKFPSTSHSTRSAIFVLLRGTFVPTPTYQDGLGFRVLIPL